MAKVYISFLGTNDYLPCRYQFAGNVPGGVVRFVQETTISVFCSSWTSDDRILIFTTQEAKKKNWFDDGHKNPKTPPPLGHEGLERRIRGLGTLACQVRRIDIPDGKDEDEIWRIFQKLYENLNDYEEVVFDITHAFRSIPMLAVIAIHYAKALKHVELAGIYYGAFEALGTLEEVTQIAKEDRIAQVLDLTPFSRLLEWTLAIDRFISSGDAGLVENLATKGVSGILKETRGGDQSAKTIQYMGKALKAFSKTMTTCRSQNISRDAKRLKTLVSNSQAFAVLPPFEPLFERIRTHTKLFKCEEIRDGIEAARWCSDHNLIQQAYTILQETLISYCVVAVQEDHRVKENRVVASQAIKIYADKISEKEWGKEAKTNETLARKVMHLCSGHPRLPKLMKDLNQHRNDLNHAGNVEAPMKAETFFKNFTKFIDQIDQVLVVE